MLDELIHMQSNIWKTIKYKYHQSDVQIQYYALII